MRILFRFVILVSAVLVPCSSLSPALLPDASGSAISAGSFKSMRPVASLDPKLGILPLSEQDTYETRTVDGLPPATAQSGSGAPYTRMVCENGVCRLVNDSEPLALGGYAQENSGINASRLKLEQIGATQIRVEFGSGDQWRCSCSLPVSPGSKVMKRFEVASNSDEQAVQEACRVVATWLREHR